MSDTTDRLERLLDYLSVDPGNVNLLQDALDLALQQHHTVTETLAAQLRAASEVPPRGRFLLATWELQQQQWSRAGDILGQLLSDGIDNAAVRYNLGLAQAFESKLADTHNTLLPLFDNPPEGTQGSVFNEAYILFAKACHHTGKLEPAKLQLHNLLEKVPTHAEALGVLALIHRDEGDRVNARIFADKALEYDPDNHEAKLTLAEILLDEQDFINARTQYDSILTHRPTSGRAWRGRGLVALLQRNAPEAERALTLALDYMQPDTGLYQALAWAQALQGNMETALQSIEKAIHADPEDKENAGIKACLLMLDNQLDRADMTLRHLSPAENESVAGQCAKSLQLLRKSEKQASADLLEHLLQRDSTLGISYLELLQRLASVAGKPKAR